MATTATGQSRESDAPADEFLAAVGTLVLAFPFSVAFLSAGLAWEGFALATIWNWFLPAVFALPRLTVGSAVAVCLVAHAIRMPSARAEEPPFSKFLAVLCMGPAIVLAVGWILHRLVLAGYVTL